MLSRSPARAFAAFFSVLVVAASAFAQSDIENRAPTQDLLPETTVAFIQVDNFRDMMTKMQESAMGRMMADENVAPLVEGLWDEAKSAYSDVEAEVGVALEDLQALPAGEMTFAVIAPRRKNPEFMLILELDEEKSDSIDRVLDRGRELIRDEAGEEIDKETSDDGIEFESFNVEGKRVKFFRKDGLMVGSTSESELDAFVDRMMGREVEKVRPLSTNRKFITIMNRCTGTKDLKPEARFFIDPIALAKSSTRGNMGAQVAINFLPVLGLDGLLGVGGSMILTEDEFETVMHGHLLLASPRKGLFEMVALKPTTYEPESWIPKDVMAYGTTSWDLDKMLAEITKMVEMYQNEEGIVDKWIEENLNEEIGMDVKEDILNHLSGRLTFMQWLEPPVTFSSQVAIVSLGIKEGRTEQVEESLEKILERINQDVDEDDDERLVEGEYNGVRYWSANPERIAKRTERRRQRREERGQPDIEVSTPEPCFAIVGDSIVFSVTSRKLLERVIDTHQGDVARLVDDPTYRIVSQKMTKLLKTDMPCAMSYNNPEDSFKFMLELAKSDGVKTLLDSQEDNKFLSGFKSQLDANPLPEMDALKQYMLPSGMFTTTDDTGYHFLAFSLREKPEVEEEE